VIGAQPELEPGQSFEYSSHCPLQTAWGTMEGSYTFKVESGEEFLAEIARFYLVADEELSAGNG
jgi:ApaG protein